MQLPEAKIYIDTLYSTGEVDAICMAKATYDLVLADLPGVPAALNQICAGRAQMAETGNRLGLQIRKGHQTYAADICHC